MRRGVLPLHLYVMLTWHVGDAIQLAGAVRCTAARAPRAAAISMQGEEAAAAAELFKRQRPMSGEEAFSDTAWQILMQLDEGGGLLFSVEFLEDMRCRFSDSDLFGEWKCEKNWVVFEKPRGLFEATLFFSAKLEPAAAAGAEGLDVRGAPVAAHNAGKLRLSEGLVQQPKPVDNTDRVEMVQLGKFGGIEQLEQSYSED